jgi:hypothetical protein
LKQKGREVSIMRIQHWQDIASLLLGAWLLVSPFVLGFAGAPGTREWCASRDKDGHWNQCRYAIT